MSGRAGVRFTASGRRAHPGLRPGLLDRDRGLHGIGSMRRRPVRTRRARARSRVRVAGPRPRLRHEAKRRRDRVAPLSGRALLVAASPIPVDSSRPRRSLSPRKKLVGRLVTRRAETAKVDICRLRHARQRPRRRRRLRSSPIAGSPRQSFRPWSPFTSSTSRPSGISGSSWRRCRRCRLLCGGVPRPTRPEEPCPATTT